MYCNQRALWNPVVAAVNECGDIITDSTGIVIKVRRQEHMEEIRTKDGTIHTSNYIYYTHADVHVDDKLDGNLVVAMYDMRTFTGRNKLRRLITI